MILSCYNCCSNVPFSVTHNVSEERERERDREQEVFSCNCMKQDFPFRNPRCREKTSVPPRRHFGNVESC